MCSGSESMAQQDGENSDGGGMKLNVKTEHEVAVKRLAELGNGTRLAIIRYLVNEGSEGVPVGQVQKALGVPPSTLSHHISRLVSVGLLRQERDSRTLYCHAETSAIDAVVSYIRTACLCAEAV